ncbi:MAG: D-2-hydroxyacid dehydrogenase [Muribaculaceae bacterium]|nr:D-2-hydroxyacid dehydrogenase [Muribaculaceae bacterium]
MKIIVLDGYVGNPGDLSWEPLERLGDVTVYPRSKPEEIIERALPADVLLTNKVVFDRKLIEALPNLKCIGVIATGFNIVDLEAANERGIVVTNVPAYSTASVAQVAIAHLLNMTTHAEHYTREARAGVWSQSIDYTYCSAPFIELDGKTMGVVGLGNIGSTVARIAAAFGMKVLAFTSKPQEALPAYITRAQSLDQVFSESDAVSLHCPLTDGTRGMVDARRLALMKPTAMLINTSRGPLIVEEDLAHALRNGVIAAAAVDVLCQEPPAPDNPLLALDNCYFTPHIGWTSAEARQRLMDVVVDNVKSFMEGHPINVVNNPK